ncbi:MAG: Rieske (2Fe-2S) protein [Polyangia bacterium]
MSERIDTSRRLLCQAACTGAGLVVLSAIPGCGGGKTEEANCSVGSPGAGETDLQEGQARWVESLQVFICRDVGGYYAMSSACTHVGAQINFVDMTAGFKCPLHFSTFDFDGHVTLGPATIDLPHYSLCTTDSGLLIVDMTKQVTADTRLVV